MQRTIFALCAGVLIAMICAVAASLFFFGPTQAEKEIDLGATLHDRGEYDGAVKHYSRAIQLDPKNSQAFLYRAHSYTFLDKYDKAVADYTRSIELNPSEAEAYLSRGDAYTQVDKYDEAILDYRQALRLDPGLATAHANLGDVFYHGTKDYQAALRHYKAALELDPTDKTSQQRVTVLENSLPNE